ncbi:MAG: hypothetical protein HRT47_09990 [Candidatus Caenarcaniphilales bacterium]|nr:hypothetical protein [Candidatus Caenarcaniphilales bacterium]
MSSEASSINIETNVDVTTEITDGSSTDYSTDSSIESVAETTVDQTQNDNTDTGLLDDSDGSLFDGAESIDALDGLDVTDSDAISDAPTESTITDSLLDGAVEIDAADGLGVTVDTGEIGDITDQAIDEVTNALDGLQIDNATDVTTEVTDGSSTDYSTDSSIESVTETTVVDQTQNENTDNGLVDDSDGSLFDGAESVDALDGLNVTESDAISDAPTESTVTDSLLDGAVEIDAADGLGVTVDTGETGDITDQAIDEVTNALDELQVDNATSSTTDLLAEYEDDGYDGDTE